MTLTPQLGNYALTVREPWATAIIHLGKSIENRSWPTNHRGRIWIHAANKPPDSTDYGDLLEIIDHTEDPDRFYTQDEDDPDAGDILDQFDFHAHLGCIIGSVEVADCVALHVVKSQNSLKQHRPWASGPWCWMLANPVPLKEPLAMKGSLGLWKVK
jgi:hypothetical protein